MGNTSSSLVWIPLFPLIGAAFNLLVGRKLPRGVVHAVAVASVMAAFATVAFTVFGPLWTHFKHRTEGQPVELYQRVYTWIQVGDFKTELAFRLDTLSAVMCLVVTGVGTLIHIYSTGYMAEEPRYATYFGYLNLFTGAMLILVLGSSMPVMFIGWEGVGVCSYLLIGFWFTNEDYATAGRKAFIVNRIGDFAFLLGMFLLFWATKSLDFADLRAAPEHAYTQSFAPDRLATAACILLFIGACGKSAQIPLYVWLPDAMAGPTPVSALIHAATMVTAGVYMVARLSFVFMHSAFAMMLVAGVGLATALLAAFYAFSQTDLKKVLAYSTVSQLGFMFVGVGTGNWVPAIFHVMTHAFFKAGLFLGAGSVMHAMGGSGDIAKMGGLRKYLPITHITFLIYCLAIAGFPLMSGWFSKDAILSGAYAAKWDAWPNAYRYVLWGGLTVAALGTAVYMWRLYFLVFAGECRADAETQAHIHESPWSMTIPLIILAVLSVFGGVFLGLPHAFHAGQWTELLEKWMQPSVAELNYANLSDTRTYELLGTASLMGLLGIFIAWRIWGNGPSAAVAKWTASGVGKDVYVASKNKLWVDELYDLLFVRPFRWIANGLFAFVDRFLIDQVLVEGGAKVIGLLGRLARWVQNGQVQRYMVGLILGAALIFFLSSSASTPGIKWHAVPEGIELDAYAGSGIQGTSAKLRWDVAGDGEWDLKPDAADRIRRELAGEPNTNWAQMVAALHGSKIAIDTPEHQHVALASWQLDELSAYLRALSPSRLSLLLQRAPKDAQDRFAAYQAAIVPKPEDYVNDPVLVERAGEVGPLVRLEITDTITGSVSVVQTRIPARGGS